MTDYADPGQWAAFLSGYELGIVKGRADALDEAAMDDDQYAEHVRALTKFVRDRIDSQQRRNRLDAEGKCCPKYAPAPQQDRRTA